MLPPRVTEYIVVYAETTDNLAREVNVKLQLGYQPWGSLAFVVDNVGSFYMFAQAMVLYE